MHSPARNNNDKKMQESLLSSSCSRPKIQNDSSIRRSLWTIGLLGAVFGFVLGLLVDRLIADQYRNLTPLQIGATAFMVVLAYAAARRHATPQRNQLHLFFFFLSSILAGGVFGDFLSILFCCRLFEIPILPLLYSKMLIIGIIYGGVQVSKSRIGACDESKEEPGRFKGREILANTV
jgi:hypothetical protein